MAEKITLKKRIAALEQVAGFVDSVRNLKQLLFKIMRVSAELLGAEASSRILYDPAVRELYFEVALGEKSGKPFRKNDVALAKIIASQAAIVIENAQLYVDNLKVERMAAVGQTIAGVSHDIKNILAGLQGGVELVDMGFKMKDEKTLADG